MVKGEFIQDIPYIEVQIGWSHLVQIYPFMVDTGFTGDVHVTPEIARELNLHDHGSLWTQMADGKIVSMASSVAYASMEGMHEYIQVFISKGIPSVGISFLSKFSYKAIIDCKYKNIFLERSI